MAMTFNFDVNGLKNGFQSIFEDTLNGLKEDVTAEVKDHAELLAMRAAQYAIQAAAGDPSAEIELQLIKGIALSVAAQVNRKEGQRIQAAILQGINVVLKFLLAAAVAA